MGDAKLPLASPEMEAQVRRMMMDGVSPEEYAARWSHTIAAFSMHGYRYQEPGVEQWVHRLGEILARLPGAPSLKDLRAKYLTAAERKAIEEEEASGEF